MTVSDRSPPFLPPEPPPTGLLLRAQPHCRAKSSVGEGSGCWCQSFPGNPCHHPIVYPRLAEPRETSPLHGLGHLIMDQSYVCALIAMMVRSLVGPSWGFFTRMRGGWWPMLLSLMLPHQKRRQLCPAGQESPWLASSQLRV